MSKKKRVVQSMYVPMWLWILLAITGVIGVWIASWFFICKYIEDIDERGMFGDMFGAVNALFSGLAFAGLIVTLLYQKEELKLQREELAQTREELKGQRVEFEEQNKTLKRQRFENTFFNMLLLQQNIVNDLFYTTKSILIQKGGYGDFIDEDKFRGRELFKYMYENAIIVVNGESYREGVKNVISFGGVKKYLEISNLTCFDHYFRHLYFIYTYLDTSKLIDEEQRYEYSCMISSQLSDYELIFLFYNSISSNFKCLIEKYSVFNNLRDELLVNIDDKKIYLKEAYNHFV